MGSPVCDSTTPDSMPLDLYRETFKVAGEEELHSSQSINDRETCDVAGEEALHSSQSINN